MKHSLSIDRFEGTLAVLLTEDGDQINVPKSMLPKGSKAGDVLTLTLERDEAATRQVADKTAQVQAELRKTDPGGVVKL
ncbi:DUF3006 domain-containing protein [Singulisphaera rosea]